MSIQVRLAKMSLGNTIRFLLSVYLVASMIFPLASFAANKDEASQNQGKIIKPSYVPALADKSSNEGKRIFETSNCSSCHSIETKGGCLGPPLDGIGAYRSKEFLLSRITNSTEATKEFERMYGTEELMPHPRLSSQHAACIVQYLLTLSPPKAGFYVHSHHPGLTPEKSSRQTQAPATTLDTVIVSAGRKLFYEHGCAACHSIGNIGGHFAPSLSGISKRRSSEYISKRITNAEFFSQNYPDEYQARGIVMPPSNLTEKEIAEITSFLMSLN